LKYKRVVVTGLGAITPIGLNPAEFWQGLAEGKNGVTLITSFDTAKYAVKLAAEVKVSTPKNICRGRGSTVPAGQLNSRLPRQGRQSNLPA